MTQNAVPLPKPYAHIYELNEEECAYPACFSPSVQRGGGLSDHFPVFTADYLHAHAVKVCAEKDAEIEGLLNALVVANTKLTEQRQEIERLRAALRSIDLDARVSRPYVGQVARLGELSRAALKEIK